MRTAVTAPAMMKGRMAAVAGKFMTRKRINAAKAMQLHNCA
jgi:hypothetical protein